MISARHRDTLPLIVSHPEHCLDCYRLMRPGDTYYPHRDNTALCLTCPVSLPIVEEFKSITATRGSH
jgi:hypothetical protein